jgi:hypothetical protein
MIKTTGCKFILFFLVIMLTSPASIVFAAPKETDCQEEKDSDRRNLCLAKINDRAEGNPLDKDRYRNKDHSSYYCTLIRSRDLQNYCYAVIEKNSKKCELLGNAELEKQCKADAK